MFSILLKGGQFYLKKIISQIKVFNTSPKYQLLKFRKQIINLLQILDMEKDFTFAGGDNPQARFGHTITQIGKDKAILFGGAVGDTGNKYTITGDTFVCDFSMKKFRKLECKGMAPSNRAAHASICIQNFLYVYGGALGGGELADDALYQLDVSSPLQKAYWTIKNCNGSSPGARYGHVLGYLRPYLIIHGGNTGSEPIGDVWINEINGISEWRKVDTGHDNPPPRVYHSASICRTGTANGMMVIFGGRGADGQPLNDTWGLRKHRDNRLDWMKAPYRSTSIKPTQRYQHKTLFIGTLLLIIGGRSNNVGESMPLDIYDTDSSEWHRMLKIDRFRHVSFLIEDKIYIHGGFDQEVPTVPTDSMLRIDLNELFKGNHNLFRGLAYELGRDFLTHNPTRRPSVQNQTLSSQSLRRSQRMQDRPVHHIPQRKIQTNRSIRLCPQAIVANFNEQRDLKKVSIQQLPAEHRKLNGPNVNSNSKDSASQVISSFFLNSLFLKPSPQLKFPIAGDYLDKILQRMIAILSEEETLLRIRAPVKIFGDLHGQAGELNRLFDAFGTPTDDQPKGDIQHTNYLFLGDYVDRGVKSLQTLILLFSLKIQYPENIFLLRGSHEDRIINRSLGFGDECQTKFKQNIDDPNSFFHKINKVFEFLPLAAVIDDGVFCAHGGIGTVLTNPNQISKIDRPISIMHDPKSKSQKIAYELLWSDPCRGREEHGSVNIDHDYFKKKINLKFSEERAEIFCSKNDLVTIIRSSQPIMEGYQAKESIISIFSCSDYGGCGNKCSILEVKKNLEIVPMVLTPLSGRQRWLDAPDRKKPSSQEDAILRSLSYTPPKA